MEDIVKNIADEFKDYVKYKSMADKCNDEDMKKKYIELADVEKSHFEFFHNKIKEYIMR